jgi:RNA polymerase-binding transcription factor DksA
MTRENWKARALKAESLLRQANRKIDIIENGDYCEHCNNTSETVYRECEECGDAICVTCLYDSKCSIYDEGKVDE